MDVLSPTRAVLTTAIAALAALVAAGSAGAVVPSKAITSAGPLTAITLGNEGSCQIAHQGDARFELFPAGAAPADCGTFVATGGALFAPAFGLHDGGTATSSLGATTPFTPVSQTDVTGSGGSGDPLKVVTIYTVGGTGLRVTQTDTYVTGQESYRTDVLLQNGGAAQSGVVYRAGDCFLQESDTGFGFVENGLGPGCSTNPGNTPPGRIEQWFPLTAGSSHIEARFGDVWSAIATMAPFPNTNVGTEQVDNGAGLSWPFSLGPGTSATFSHVTAFSPAGVTAGQQQSQQPPSRPAALPPAFGPNGVISAPSNRRCISRRRFRIRIRQRRGLQYEQVIVFVNGRRVAVRRGQRITAPVDLRGLPRGRFRVTITVITTSGDVIRGVRRYRTCAPRRSRRNRGPV